MEDLQSAYKALDKEKQEIEGKIADLNEILNCVSFLELSVTELAT